MSHQPDDFPLDTQLDELLRRSTPTASTAFEASLERTLFARSQRRATSKRWAGFAAATSGLAAVVLIASLAGGGPLAKDGGSAAKAKPGCTIVYVAKVEPVGQVVKRADGTVTVETTRKPVFHERQRCR